MFLKVSPYVCLKKFGKEMGGKNICLFKKILKRCGKYYVYSMGWIMFLFLSFKITFWEV